MHPLSTQLALLQDASFLPLLLLDPVLLIRRIWTPLQHLALMKHPAKRVSASPSLAHSSPTLRGSDPAPHLLSISSTPLLESAKTHKSSSPHQKSPQLPVPSPKPPPGSTSPPHSLHLISPVPSLLTALTARQNPHHPPPPPPHLLSLDKQTSPTAQGANPEIQSEQSGDSGEIGVERGGGEEEVGEAGGRPEGGAVRVLVREEVRGLVREEIGRAHV